MSIKFRNYDKRIIRKLLSEIGEHRYTLALENMKVGDNRPLSMKGFYLEATEHYLRLCYVYPSNYVLMIMDVGRYENIPVDGWSRVRE